MIKEKVYLETSVISFLTGRLSRDVVKLAKQELTRQWWERNRSRFDLHISSAVVEEITAGDSEAIGRRLEAIAGLPVLDIDDEITELFKLLIANRIVPPKATADALHIAVAAVHGMSYLLTWNCKHINNAATRKKVAAIITRAGYSEVIMATPEELGR